MAVAIWLTVACSAAAFAAPTAIHQLDIRILPSEHRLIGRDRVTVMTDGDSALTFRISPRVNIDVIRINQKERKASFGGGRLTIPLAAEERGRIVVDIGYHAKFQDPVPVNPVNTDNPGYGVSASISERGCLLLSGAGWYPELERAAAVYDLKIVAPAGWLAVTSGRLKGHRTEENESVSEWFVKNPSEGLSLSVAPFKVTTKTSGRLKAATYFLADEPRLAQAYLDATLQYLKLYSELIGPYAFDQFAVVENFFPTGYGFPGYTLLGSRVLRLPFIISTSLGHEVAHCWWGNGVSVDYSEGNWSEGLTTYLADYFYKERQSPGAALAYRRQALRNYASLVTPASEFPLAQFMARHSPLTKAIGYDKGTMVFHMLRQQIGEEAFWGGLKDVYRDRLFRKTAWSDLRAAFEKRAGRPLGAFFDQWVNRKGAPEIRLRNVRLNRPRPSGPWVIRGSIHQGNDFYSFPVDLKVHTDAGSLDHPIQVQRRQTDFEVTSKYRPLEIELDPGVNLFRRLDRSEIPPTVNSLKGTGRIALLVNEGQPEQSGAAKTLAASLGYARVDGLSMDMFGEGTLPPVDILVVGRPPEKGQLTDLMSRHIKDEGAFQLNDQTYDRGSDVFFGVFRHPTAADRVVAFFWPIGEAGAAAARKITHYGKYSYLVFRDGRNVAKGTWPIESSPIIYRWK